MRTERGALLASLPAGAGHARISAVTADPAGARDGPRASRGPLWSRGAFQGVDEFTIIELPFANPSGTIAGDFPCDELAEDRSDRAVVGQVSEVGPHVVSNIDPRHAVATSRRDAGPGLRSPSATTAHNASVEAHTRRRRISVQVRLCVGEGQRLAADPRGP
jgi:hypothetical protein